MSRAARKRVDTRRSSPAYAPPVATIGPGRYTPGRFLSDCSEDTRDFLVSNWSEGNQLVARRVPVDGLPPVVLLACYARQYGVELVDDYEALLERYWENVGECYHPDKFMASCIIHLHARGLAPGDEAFESVNIPKIYEELFP